MASTPGLSQYPKRRFLLEQLLALSLSLLSLLEQLLAQQLAQALLKP